MNEVTRTKETVQQVFVETDGEFHRDIGHSSSQSPVDTFNRILFNPLGRRPRCKDCVQICPKTLWQPLITKIGTCFLARYKPEFSLEDFRDWFSCSVEGPNQRQDNFDTVTWNTLHSEVDDKDEICGWVCLGNSGPWIRPAAHHSDVKHLSCE